MIEIHNWGGFLSLIIMVFWLLYGVYFHIRWVIEGDSWLELKNIRVCDGRQSSKVSKPTAKVKNDDYESVRELFEDNYHKAPIYETSVSDGTERDGGMPKVKKDG